MTTLAALIRAIDPSLPPKRVADELGCSPHYVSQVRYKDRGRDLVRARHAAEMRRCLEDLDVAGVRRLWAATAPHMPQGGTDAEVLVMLHMARTAAESLNLRLRAWSHRWLVDNGYPSQLPDQLKPRAERIYPKIVDAVGVAAMSKYPQVAAEIGGAMIDVVENCYADRKTDPEYVRPRMMDARRQAQRRLGLRQQG